MFRFIFLLLLAFGSLEAGTIRAVLLGDDLDPKCGSGFKQSLKIVEEEVYKISEKLEMPCEIVKLEGQKVTTENLIQAVRGLTISEDDIVILYCACHGNRTPSKKNRWPTLTFKREKKGIDFGILHRVIELAEPQFMLAIADCCNNMLPEKKYPLVAVKTPKKCKKKDVSKGKGPQLLGNHKSLVVSACSPAEYSWTSLKEGNYFTRFFFQSINEEKERVLWGRVLEKTTRALEEQVNSKKPLNRRQHPQYKLS